MGNTPSQTVVMSKGSSTERLSGWGMSDTHGQFFRDVKDLKDELRQNGVRKLNLILGIDFTASNNWTGKMTFGGKNLHDLSSTGALNPYEQAISIIGESLQEFSDGPIPTYGFGCSKTRDSMVFTFNEGDAACRNVQHVLSRYREIVPQVTLAGPTSFAPIIQKACDITARSGNQYHLLVIIADGQVTHPDGQPAHILSPQEQTTIRSIVNACSFPLSIVCVGVGDGPWESMRHFDNKLTSRSFDNFRFVSLSDSLTHVQNTNPHDPPNELKRKMDDRFALEALLEVPWQFREIKRLNLLGMEAAHRSARKVDLVATVQPSALRVPDVEPPTGYEDGPQTSRYIPVPGSQPFVSRAPLPTGSPQPVPLGHPFRPVMIPSPMNMPPPPANMTYAIAPQNSNFPLNSIIIAPISDCIVMGPSPMLQGAMQGPPNTPRGPMPPPGTGQPPFGPPQAQLQPPPSYFNVLPPPQQQTSQHTNAYSHLPPPGVLPPPVASAPFAPMPPAAAPGANPNRYSTSYFDYTNPNPLAPSAPPPRSASAGAFASATSASTTAVTSKSGLPSATAPGGDASDDAGGKFESECPVCFGETRNVALQCGHIYCQDCAYALDSCAICRQKVVTRIRLYA